MEITPHPGVGDFSISGGDLGTEYLYEDHVLTILSASPLTITMVEGVESTTTDYIIVDDGTNANLTLDGVYIDMSSNADTAAIDLQKAGACTITLADGSENTLLSGQNRAGIEVPDGYEITFDGNGTLTVTGGYAPGIGNGTGEDRTNIITINNGTITANGGIYYGAGIGGGYQSDGGTITITGGMVTATGNSGIGGGSLGDSGTIMITGGTVTATGRNGAGIGGGSGGSGGEITISGGTVTAKTTSQDGAGIGGGSNGGSGGKITIEGGSVTATGGWHAAGIGDGFYGSGGEITISGGTVNAKGGTDGAGIGSGSNGHSSYKITIQGGTVTAASEMYGAGIGGGGNNSGGEITISGGEIIATGGGYGAGIGGGESADGGTIIISGGEITATGGKYGAGIGGGGGLVAGGGGSGGTIMIEGGDITATGGDDGSGIGKGFEGDDGAITITGGTVIASCDSDGYGISGTFTTGTDGHAVIYASSIEDTSDSDDWSGIISSEALAGEAVVYGSPIITTDESIPSGKTAHIEEKKNVTIAEGTTFTNEGTVYQDWSSTFTKNGTYFDNGTTYYEVASDISYLDGYEVDISLGGTTKYSGAYYAAENSTVSVTLPDRYHLFDLSVVKYDDNKVSVSDNSFTMPSEPVMMTGVLWQEIAASLTMDEGENYTYYGTVQKAVNAAGEDAGIVTMLTDSVETVTIAGGQNITLDLSGYTLDGGKAGSVITNNGTLILQDNSTDGTGVVTGGYYISGSNPYGGGIYSTGTFTMEAGTISGNAAGQGGGVYNDKGQFTMEGGKIINNTCTMEGGGVFNLEGEFIMTDGSISNNTYYGPHNDIDGGGVYNRGEFTMIGGEISGNTAIENGGGVSNLDEFTLEDGKIYGNEAEYGGGVHNSVQSSFKMNGGEISGNTVSWNGGGIVNSGEFTMYGGAVYKNAANNEGADVYADPSVSGEHTTLLDADEMNENASDYIISDWFYDEKGNRYADAEDPTKYDVVDGDANKLSLIAGCVLSLSYDLNNEDAVCEGLPDVTHYKADQTEGYSATVTAAAPTLAGYIFAGWATEADAKEAEYQADDEITFKEDTVLYAVWNSYDLLLSVASDLTDNSRTYDGESFTLTTTPTISPELSGVSYTYQWYKDDEELDGKTDNTLTLDGNVSDSGTYTCKVKADIEGVEYDAEGEIEITIRKAGLTVSANNESIVYGGDAPAFTVTYDGFVNDETESVLSGTVTYDCEYTAGDNAGTYTITPSGLTADNYEITFEDGILTVTQAQNSLTITEDLDKTYDGDAVEGPDVMAGFGGDTVEFTWYEVDEGGEVIAELDQAPSDAGTYKVVASVPETDNYAGASAELTFTITPQKITEGQFDVDIEEVTYSGSEITKEILSDLTEGEDYTVSYENNINAGTATITITGIGNYSGELEYTFTINKAVYDMSGVSFADATYTYNKEEHTITITGELPEGVTVAYTDNTRIDVGSQTATASFTGDVENYEPIDSKTATLTILDATFVDGEVTGEGYDGTYDGQAHSIIISLTGDAEGATVTYSESEDGEYTEGNPTYTDVGTYTVYYKVSKANYTDVTGTLTVKITEKTITEKMFTVDTTPETYSGEAFTKEISAADEDAGNDPMTEDTDYEVSYADNTNAGIATITITGIGNYTGTLIYTFEIEKAAQEISYVVTSITKLETAKAFINELTTEFISSEEGSGVTYSSSDESIAIVDEDTGEIIIDGTGKVTITATAAETANYAEATASYELTVVAPEETVTADVKDHPYDGNEIHLYANIEHDMDGEAGGLTYSYQWYRDEVLIEGETEEVLTLRGSDVSAQKGTVYTCVITISDDYFTDEVWASFTVTILQADNSLTITTESLDKTYDGVAVKEPEVTADFGEDTVEFTWYEVDEDGTVIAELDQAPSDAGTYKVVASVPETNNYAGASAELKFTIVPEEITKEMFTVDTRDETYSGSKITKEILSDLAEGTDYSLSYEDNVNVGTATITITGEGNYTGEVTYTFKIEPQEITDDLFTVDTGDETYSGSKITKDIITDLTEGTDYTVSYTGNTNAGAATITITGKGNYSGELTYTFTINKAVYDMSGVSFADATYTYNKEEQAITITGELPDGVTVSYADNTRTDVGSQTATASFTGDADNYELIDSRTATLTILEATFVDVEVTGEGYDGTYDGQAHSITVSLAGDAEGATITYSESKDGEYTEENPTYTDAGTYTVYYKVSKTNYSDVTGSLTVNIAGKAVTEEMFTVDTNSETYSGKAFTKEISAADEDAGNDPMTENAEYTVEYSDNINAGEATITIAGIGNYTGMLTYTFVIEKAAQEISYNVTSITKLETAKAFINDLTQTFISPEKGSGVTYSSSDESIVLVDEDTGEIIIDGTGTVTITATAAETANYAEATASYELTVVAPEETVTSDVEDHAYDGKEIHLYANIEHDLEDEADNLTYSYQWYRNGDLIEGETGEILTLSGNDVSAQEGTIYTCVITISDDYFTDTVKASFTVTISQAENSLTITEDLDKTYDGGAVTESPAILADFGADTVTYTWYELDESGEITGEALDVAPVNAGTYRVVASIAGTDNYAGASDSADFEISKAQLTVTAEDQSIKYGEAAPGFTVTYDGFVDGETESVLGGALAFTCEYTAGDNVGSYTIMPYGLTADNYEITFVDGILTVTQAQNSLTITEDLDKTYDGNAVTESPDILADFGADTVTYTWYELDESGEITGEALDVAPANAGTYRVVASIAETDNYAEASDIADFEISKAQLIVTAEDQSIKYGEAAPAFTVTYDGFVDGETESVLGGTVTYDCEYTAGDNVGTYTITPSELTADNYEITFVEGTLTVTQAQNSLMITEDLDKTYDGGAVEDPEVSADFGEDTVTFTWYAVDEDGEVTAELDQTPSDAGTYKVVASVPETNNYAGASTELTFAITPQDITDEMFTVDMGNETYSGAKITKEILSDLTEGTDYTVSYTGSTNAGTATITIAGMGNYSGKLTYTFEIEAADISDATVGLSEEDYTYDGKEKTPAVSVTLANGTVLTEGKDYTVSYENNIEAGTATVTVTGIGNYTGTVTASFTISKVPETEAPQTETETPQTDEPETKQTSATTTTALLMLKGEAAKKSVTLSWNKVQNADGYIIYSARCGKNLKELTTVEGRKNTTYKVKGLKKATRYKFKVKAYKIVDGEKKILKKSNLVHVVTTSKKYTNVKSVKVSQKEVNLRLGRTKKITASARLIDSEKKLRKHMDYIRYISYDTSVATVNKKGKITAVGKGTCKIYAYAADGARKKITVTVK